MVSPARSLVAIFGWDQDPHVIAVCEELRNLDQDFSLFDIHGQKQPLIQSQFSASCDLAIGKTDPQAPPSAVWRRIKPPFELDYDGLSDYYDKQFALSEWIVALEFAITELSDAFVLNNKAADLRASNKLLQLKTAEKFGFKIPRTLCSNDPVALSGFLSSLDRRECIHKSLNAYISPDARLKFTTLFQEHHVSQYSAQIAVCPSLFQEPIRSKYEIRVTVVGDEIFAAKIEKPEASDIDWRRTSSDNRYAVMTLDQPLTDRILALQKIMGLSFACYDFIVDDDDQVYFLEVNSAGQWMWLEDELGLPISNRIAKILTEKASRGS